MSTHPSKEKLAELAWDALEGAEADSVEAHVATCGDCALHVERVRAEARRITAALHVEVPAGLSGKILDRCGEALSERSESKSRAAAWAGLAAAALFAVTTAWAWRGMDSANLRIDRLEKEIAATRNAKPPAVVAKEESIEDILKRMTRIDIEGDLNSIVATVPLDPKDAPGVSLALANASDATTEMLVKAVMGQIHFSELESVDTFLALESDLKPKLEPAQFAKLDEALQRRSRADAVAVAKLIIGDLQIAAGLDQAQAAALEAIVVDRTSWRRDFHFLPDVARQELASRALGAGGSLKPQAEALLNQQQRVSVLEYLGNAETQRGKAWENLRNKH